MGIESEPEFQLKELTIHHCCPFGNNPSLALMVFKEEKPRSRQRARECVVTSYVPLTEENLTICTWEQGVGDGLKKKKENNERRKMVWLYSA